MDAALNPAESQGTLEVNTSSFRGKSEGGGWAEMIPHLNWVLS